MKKEEIDQLVTESFEKANGSKLWEMFIDNADNLERELKKNQEKVSIFVILFATCSEQNYKYTNFVRCMYGDITRYLYGYNA